MFVRMRATMRDNSGARGITLLGVVPTNVPLNATISFPAFMPLQLPRMSQMTVMPWNASGCAPLHIYSSYVPLSVATGRQYGAFSDIILTLLRERTALCAVRYDDTSRKKDVPSPTGAVSAIHIGHTLLAETGH